MRKESRVVEPVAALLFATVLAEVYVYVGAKNLRRGRRLIAEVLREPPVVAPLVATA